jgi:hypothetical protein
MKLRRGDQSGFTIMGLLSALLVVTFFVAVVGGIIYVFYNTARTTSLEGDRREVQAAVTDFATASSAAGTPRWPTADGSLPPSGGYTPINFAASFVDRSGMTVSFYPDFLKHLPRHWNEEGVWLIDRESNVSADIESGKY